MLRLLGNWLLSALALLIVAHLVPGFYIAGLLSALIAAVVIGFVNATLGLILKIVTFPLTLATLGLFWWVINAVMLWLAAALVPGFRIASFFAALVGSVALALVNLFFGWLFKSRRAPRAR